MFTIIKMEYFKKIITGSGKFAKEIHLTASSATTSDAPSKILGLHLIERPKVRSLVITKQGVEIYDLRQAKMVRAVQFKEQI